MKLVALSIIVPLAECAIHCGAPLDVVFLQDTTGSFDADLPLIVKQLPIITAAILSVYEDSRFGVAEFRDKPFYPLGQPDDFCYKLNTGKLTSVLSDFYWAYQGLMASGGADSAESSFQALINVALDPAVGWSDRNRLVVLNTDAVTHLPGDMEKYPSEEYPQVPHGLPPNSGDITGDDVNYSCLFEDYPSPDQVRDALKTQEINLIIFTPNEYSNVTASWAWTNEYLLEQPSNYYQFIENDSSNIAEKLIKLLNEIAPECPITTPGPDQSTASMIAATEENSETAASSEENSETAASSLESEATGSGGNTCPCPGPCLPPCGNPCCDSNEVMVFLKHKPSHLHMEIRN